MDRVLDRLRQLEVSVLGTGELLTKLLQIVETMKYKLKDTSTIESRSIGSSFIFDSDSNGVINSTPQGSDHRGWG